MKLPVPITHWLTTRVERYIGTTPRDRSIPPDPQADHYMWRWHRFRLKWLASCYYNLVLRSDDDRSLHDHPWWNISIVLRGGYWEHTIAAGGIHQKVWRGPGSVVFRRASAAHRLELNKTRGVNPHLPTLGNIDHVPIPALTIFLCGPVLRRWGFHHPSLGWTDAKHWDSVMDHGKRTVSDS